MVDRAPKLLAESIEAINRDPDAIEGLPPDPQYKARLRQTLVIVPKDCISEEAGRIIRRDVRAVIFAKDKFGQALERLSALDAAFGSFPEALRGDRDAIMLVADACERWGFPQEKNAMIGALEKTNG